MNLTNQFTKLFIAILICMTCSPAMAQLPSSKAPLTLPIQAFRTESGATILTVKIQMEHEWYTYADTPGGMGKPTKFSGQTLHGKTLIPFYPEGIQSSDAFDPSVTVYKYKNGTLLFATAPPKSQFPFQLRLDLLLCHPTRCVPIRRDIQFGESLDIDTLPQAEVQNWWPQYQKLSNTIKQQESPLSPQEKVQENNEVTQWNFSPLYLQPGLEVTGIFSAILMGLLAGLILNIMPCVLPVVSLKLSALLNSSSLGNEESRIAAFREHNIFFALGVLTFFIFLAIVLGATGQAWGALFQHQWLVLGVAGIIFALSLSLFGLFHLPVIDLKFGSKSKNPKVQAFFTGNLTTLLATPCSGPFLGGVLSWALVQGPIILMTVFVFIGIGMASPYMLMVINPKLSRFLPKSGPWIEFVEKGIAFFLVGTACYLLAIALGGNSLRILGPLWALVLSGWLWVRTRPSRTLWKWGIRIICAVLVIGIIQWTTPSKVDDEIWETFTTPQFQTLLGKKKLFLDFTADWCPTCKVLEGTVLTPENITRWKKKYNVVFVKVDMTDQNLENEGLLKALGSMSIPTAALFPTGSKSQNPLVLRDLFTQSQLENILESWEK